MALMIDFIIDIKIALVNDITNDNHIRSVTSRTINQIGLAPGRGHRPRTGTCPMGRTVGRA